MAEPTALPTGEGGTRHGLTKIAFVIGAVLEGFAGVLLTLQAGGIVAGWFPMALAVVGVILQISTYFGYVRSETLIKRAVLEARAPAGPQ